VRINHNQWGKPPFPAPNFAALIIPANREEFGLEIPVNREKYRGKSRVLLPEDS
jgi:hypothetical protein